MNDPLDGLYNTTQNALSQAANLGIQRLFDASGTQTAQNASNTVAANTAAASGSGLSTNTLLLIGAGIVALVVIVFGLRK